jgi:hypothetical protein
VGSAGQRERTREQAVSVGRRGPRRERTGTCARGSAPTGRPHRAAGGRERERERERESTREGVDRRVRLSGGLARGRGRARGGWSGWAVLGRNEFFYFQRISTFSILFFRGFNSNSNQIKHVHQFKEYFRLSMMQQSMTYITLTK